MMTNRRMNTLIYAGVNFILLCLVRYRNRGLGFA